MSQHRYMVSGKLASALPNGFRFERPCMRMRITRESSMHFKSVFDSVVATKGNRFYNRMG